MPVMNDTVFGVLFAAVAGIMVFISFDELLPAAREYGEHHLSIYGLIGGMAVMAISLVGTKRIRSTRQKTKQKDSSRSCLREPSFRKKNAKNHSLLQRNYFCQSQLMKRTLIALDSTVLP